MSGLLNVKKTSKYALEYHFKWKYNLLSLDIVKKNRINKLNGLE